MKPQQKTLIALIILAILLGVTLTLALLILVKNPILVIPFTGLLTLTLIMSIYSFYLGKVKI